MTRKDSTTQRVPDIAPYVSKYLLGGKVSTPVHQYGLDGKYIRTFASIKLASQTLMIHSSGIINCLKGKQHQTGGFQWRKA
ncbi:MAG: NUMOD1 domain-containing DNA-binding protein [Bacteroidales bacterium]|jgi:hypothetical protein